MNNNSPSYWQTKRWNLWVHLVLYISTVLLMALQNLVSSVVLYNILNVNRSSWLVLSALLAFTFASLSMNPTDIVTFSYSPQITIATSIIFCHRFFIRQSHARNDRRVSIYSFACYLVECFRDMGLLFFVRVSLLHSCLREFERWNG